MSPLCCRGIRTLVPICLQFLCLWLFFLRSRPLADRETVGAWLQLSQELGFPLYPKSNLTFSKCLEMGLQEYIEPIAKVAEVAGKEYSIEQVRAGIL